MTRPVRVALIVGSLLGLGGAGALLAWHFWPQPPPTTADQVYEAVMASDPLQLPEKELERWIQHVANTVERLPPHEFEKLLTKALQDERLRERFESLKPEQRRKLMDMVSEEQRSRMMAKMGPSMVKFFQAMPAPLRKVALREMRAKAMERHKQGGGRGPELTKQRIMQYHAATTPQQRAEFVRSMREMRKMLEEAGVEE